jgi:Asp-tRNA(Asn)/Glu-tRNA(Gln) amidotransferase A subunit family amidase
MASDPPTEAEVEAAERLLGVAHTPAERAQIARSLEPQIAAARARRAVELPHGAPGALRFDPRPPGFAMPAPPEFRPAPRKPRPLPGEEDVAFAPLPDLAAWIASGALTSRRLTELYLARIEAHAPRLECFAALAPERALAEAEAMDALTRAGVSLGPLHGLPYGLKDLFDTAGLATEWGAEPFAGRVPEADARVVTLLRAAGAVMLGKTAVGALAYGDVWSGGTARNPWNPEEGAWGSSAGSASAVAAGLCAFAIGTETLGSITSPCQRCGTTGLRPTFGRVSRAGCMTLCPSLDKVGPIARGVEDCACVLAALNGGDPADRGSIDAPFGWDPAAPLRGLRLGYLPDAFGEGATEVDHAALAAARTLGLEVVEARLPDLPYDALLALLQAEAAASFEPLTLSGEDDLLTRQDDDAWPNLFRRARFLSAVDHVQTDRLRFAVMEALGALFREVDVLIGPFATGPMLVASNFTGHPCLHLRAGFLETPSRGRAGLQSRRAASAAEGPLHTVPQGISLWGPLFREDLVLRVGLALEAALDVADRRPPL